MNNMTDRTFWRLAYTLGVVGWLYVVAVIVYAIYLHFFQPCG